MSATIRDLFQRALKDERKTLRPYFFPAATAEPVKLVTEESYLRLRLSRMFLKNRRELFKTHYPMVNVLMQFAGLEGPAEVSFVVQPSLPAQTGQGDLVDVVTLNQTILGPVLYRGGDLRLMIGLYAAPGEDWAQRFIKVAEGVSQLAMNAPLATAVSLAGVVKTSMENSLGSNGLDLRLGLDKELTADSWLKPGYLVMIAAPDTAVDPAKLQITDGELRTAGGAIYSEHDYIVVAIEATNQRSDWQSLGYGGVWQKLVNTAATSNNVDEVKESYAAFSGAILGSADLSWTDRNAIIASARQRVMEIRETRGTDFITKQGNARAIIQLERLRKNDLTLPEEPLPQQSAADLLNADWLS